MLAHISLTVAAVVVANALAVRGAQYSTALGQQQPEKKLTLGHILKTFVSHDCDLEKRLLVLDRSRKVARGGVKAEDPLDTAADLSVVWEN